MIVRGTDSDAADGTQPAKTRSRPSQCYWAQPTVSKLRLAGSSEPAIAQSGLSGLLAPVALPEAALLVPAGSLVDAAPLLLVLGVAAVKDGVAGAVTEIVSVALGAIITAAGALGVTSVLVVADCPCAWSMISVNIAKAKIGATRSRLMSQRLMRLAGWRKTNR